jgi:hypothetical protein
VIETQNRNLPLLRPALSGFISTEMKAGADHVVCKHDDWNTEGYHPLLIHITELPTKGQGKESNVG